MTEREADDYCDKRLANGVGVVSVAQINKDVDVFVKSRYFKALKYDR